MHASAKFFFFFLTHYLIMHNCEIYGRSLPPHDTAQNKRISVTAFQTSRSFSLRCKTIFCFRNKRSQKQVVLTPCLRRRGIQNPRVSELRQCRHHSVNAATGVGVRQCFMVAENALQTVSCEEGHSTHSTFVSVDTSLHLDGR